MMRAEQRHGAAVILSAAKNLGLTHAEARNDEMLGVAEHDKHSQSALSGRGRRIVLATFGSLGDLFPFLAIGAELKARGHHPLVATSALYRGQVAAAGLDFAAVRPDRTLDQRDPDFIDRLLRERQPPGALFRQMFLPSPRESLQDLLPAAAGADAIVSHTLVSAARLAAEARALPWISAVMQPMGYLSAYDPPVLGHPGIAAMLRRCGPGVTRRLLLAARALTGVWAREWHDLRAELGLPPTREHPLWEGQHSPRRSLGLFPRLLGEPRPDWPASARVTGFPFFTGAEQALDPVLDSFLADGDPPLVFTLGTTAVNDPGPFYEESAAAARRLGARAVLIGGGERTSEPETSPNTIVVASVPHALVFPRARAIVHQGGIGTLSAAMAAGVPMLIMPYGHDQADNAWRAARLGVARVIPRRRYRAGAVARELARLLADPGITATTAGVSAEVARERGAARAADLIEAALH